MTLDEVKEYFGSSYQFHKKTGMNHRNYYNWRIAGYIPIKTQMKLEKLSNQGLKAELHDVNWERS
jgi:hypothetical protein